MIVKRQQVMDAALSLPEGDRAELVARLLDSIQDEDSPALRAALARITPPNEQLLRHAETHRPPQSWFDDDTDPFQPEQAP